MIKKIIQTLINEKWLQLIIGGIIINALCFLMYFSSNAQGLPYFVDNDDFVAVYGLTADEFIQAVNGSRFAQSNGIVLSLEVPGTYIFNGVENGINYTEIIIPTSNYIGSFEIANGVTYETWNSDNNYLTLTSNVIYYYLYERDTLQNALLYYYGYGNLNNFNSNFYGVTGNEIGYLVSDYNWNLDPSYKIVTNYADPLIEVGIAIVPPTPLDPSYLNGDTAPVAVPAAPNITSYTWTNPPAFDNSTVINGIQSIKDTLEWLADNIQGTINNLLNNIKGLFEYIGKTIQYYGNMIIQTLNNLIQNFYDNMKSLVEDIAGTIKDIYNLLTNPLDTTLLTNQLNSSSFVGAIRTTKSQISGFFNMFSNISQPNNVIFEIDLTGLWFNGGVSYLDFSIISPILPLIRLVLGCILLYSLIVTIFTNINTYIGGNSAKNDSGG